MSEPHDRSDTAPTEPDTEAAQEPTDSDAPQDGDDAPQDDVAQDDVALDDAADAPPAEPGPPEEPQLIPPGNPLRPRGAVALGLGALLAFVVMTLGPQFRWGVPLGALGVFAATFGVLDLLGSFDDPEERVAGRTSIQDLVGPLALLGAGLAATVALVCLAVEGHLAATPFDAGGRVRLGLLLRSSAWLVPAAFLVTVVGVYKVGERLGPYQRDEAGERRPLVRRHGFWLIAAISVLYLPMLGSHSLSDPWETHYGEVSREILSRNDWISLWWAQDGWFWSKPIFGFWIQALAMATFGVRYRSGEMLSAAAEGRTPWPEWAVRLPIFLLTLTAAYLLYKAVAKIWGRRAGLLGGLVLTTMPQWFMVSHQTMTDMPFVATMAAAMALFLLGIHTPEDEVARVYEVRVGPARLRLSAYHLVLGAVIACALPQILYLLSRNLDIRLAPFDLRFHADAFRTGSPGNCGLPGNDACHGAAPVLRGLQPSLQALVWAQALGVVLYANWGERRIARLCFLAAWFFAALSTMAKGPAGFGLPVLCALVYVIVSRRHRDLLRMEIPSGLLLLACVALPWFVAMYARHGQPFTDRLIFHDILKRAFSHVHDTNEGDDVSFRYYLWQLGYAMFPWTGLVPAALVGWLRRREGARGAGPESAGEPGGGAGERQVDASLFLVMWFLFAFALFSLMMTKFHHYILPAVPPAAMLTGVLLDDLLRLSGAPRATGAAEGAARHERVMLGAMAVAGALLVFFVGRDLAMAREGQPSQARLLHLFTYNYKRTWPPSLDFSRALWAFVIAAAALTLLLAVARWRRHVAAALVSLAVIFTAWGLDIYFVRTAPHWGQRETLLAYARENGAIPGPLVAYQMNWKGENFYAGNRLPAFVSSGKKFQDYINDQKKKGVKTFYFLTEHGRTGSLSNEIGSPRVFDKLTPPELNNKFLLVRATFE